ncbi:hypothetical protein ACFYNO_00905 [Kitasatospora sp. NPDC006697]|uniref:hypothetical protein n=1 Tax=Kitasatospora sp. NPDC006697 TaxID=3364020 RepID=UPI0036783A7E
MSTPPTQPWTRPRALASVLLVAAYALLMVFLVLFAMDRDSRLPNLNFVLPALVSGLLGLVTNPGSQTAPWLWTLMALEAGTAALLAGVQVLLHPANVGALPAMVAAVAAFGSLFLDSTTVTHRMTGRN